MPFKIPLEYVAYYDCAAKELFFPFDNINVDWESKSNTTTNLIENGYIKYTDECNEEYRWWNKVRPPVLTTIVIDNKGSKGKVSKISISSLSYDLEKINNMFNSLKAKYEEVKINGTPLKKEKKGINSFNVKMFITEDNIFKSQRFEIIITRHKRMYK